MIQSNSKIFSTSLFGLSTNQEASAMTEKDLSTMIEYLQSSGISNMGTKLPRVPSNQRVAKD